MTDVIELSSDEEICVPTKNIYKEYADSDATEDVDLSDILKKYSDLKKKYNVLPVAPNSPKQNSSGLTESGDITNNPEKLPCKNVAAYIHSADEIRTSSIAKDYDNSRIERKSRSKYNKILKCANTDPKNYAPKVKKAKSQNNNDKQLKKLERERTKAEKQAEKNRQKEENEKAKAEKQALAKAYKNLKPEECIKNVTVFVDAELMSHACGTHIPTALQEANMTYKIVANTHAFTVTWSQKNQPQLAIIEGQLNLAKNDEVCKDVLLIILWDEFVNLVHNTTLTSEMEIKQSLYPHKRIHLGIFGLDNYFSYHKNQCKKSKDKSFANVPQVSRQDIDMALIELQVVLNISHRMLDKPEDVSAMVAQFTKSIAQIPYKIHKQQTVEQMQWYVAGDNKNCVRVDKNGYGLFRLWQQQLMQFTLASLETAEAIALMYPTPTSLMRAYAQCSSKTEGEKLLQDITVRRAAGLLSTGRKIGPELSRKVYALFTSTDGTALL